MAYGNTGIFLSNGATNVMPVGPHAKPKDGSSLSEEQLKENADMVHRAWRLSYSHIRHSLVMGYYQGWDLHPAQVPIRYAPCLFLFGRRADGFLAFEKLYGQSSAGHFGGGCL